MNRKSGFHWIVALALGAGVATEPSRGAPPPINTATLNSYVGVHPRLLLDTTSIATLRTEIADNTNPKSSLWTLVRNNANSVSVSTPQAFYLPSGSGDRTQEWQRTVGGNASDLAFAYLMTKPSPSGQSIWMEAEESITPLDASNVMTITAYSTASSGRYIEPTGVGSPGAVGAQYVVATTTPADSGAYRIWVRAASNYSGQDFKVQVDNLNSSTVAFTGNTNGWIWMDAGSVPLTPGNHTLSILYDTRWVRIDKILVSSDSAYASAPPSGTGTEQHWLEAWKSIVQVPANIDILGADQIAANLGHYLKTKVAHSSAPATADVANSFTVGGSGTYDFWVRYKCPYSTNNGSYFSVDTGNPVQFYVQNSLYQEWAWQKVAGNVSLTAGSHTFYLSAGQYAGSLFDRFLVTTAGQPSPADPNKYLVGALHYALASCSYPTWGAWYNNTTQQWDINDGTDLAAGHQLVGLALLYDWCYSDLGATDRQTLYGKLFNFGLPTMQAGSQTTGNWIQQRLLNRYYVNVAGLGAGALAIYGDNPNDNATVLSWLNQSVAKISDTADALGPDGANQEGIGYYEYGLSYLLQYTAMANKVLGVTLDSGTWFQNTPLYRLAFSLPANSWNVNGTNTSIDFADANRSEWAGSNYLLRRLASLCKTTRPTNASLAQGLADQLDLKGANAYGSGGWLSLVWHNDPAVTSLSPTAAGLSTLHYFDDYDFAVARSGWDGAESVLAYQCGPFLGHTVQALEAGVSPYVDWGAGHAHPAANNFCLFGEGDWLIRNDGYAEPKWTAQLNSLLINGAGQLGEGGSWFSTSAAGLAEDAGGTLNPAINDTLSYSTAPFDYLVGDATKAYATASGLTKFTRHLLFYKPDVLVVVDDTALSAAPTTQELRFFTEQTTVTQVDSGTYTTTGVNALLKVNLLGTGSSLGTGTIQVIDNTGASNTRRYLSVQPSAATAQWGTATAFTWAPTTGSPRQVTMITDDAASWKFRIGGKNVTLVLNRTTGSNGVVDQARLMTVLEAESGTFPSGTNMQTHADATASGGTYVATKATISGTQNPDITYSLTVPDTALSQPATYTLWARCQAANGNSDSYYYNLDGAANTQLNVSPYNIWKWMKLTTLPAGSHTLNILHRESNCKIDEFLVSDDPTFTPVGAY